MPKPAAQNCPKRILHLITSLESGGAENMLYKIMQAARSNHRFKYQVVSLRGTGVYGPLLKEIGVSVFCLNLAANMGDVWRLLSFIKLLRRFKPHVMQTWLYHADLIGLMIGSIAGVRHIVWNVRCSNMDLGRYAWTTRLIFKLLRRLSGYPDAICANSHAGIEYHAREQYRPKKWILIPNGFDTERFKPAPFEGTSMKSALGIPDKGFVIGMVARYDPVKNFDTFLHAARKIAELRSDVFFVLIGRNVDSLNPQLGAKVEKLGLRERLLLLGERDDLEKLYPAMDLFTLSSDGEGFPNVIGEAMACGIPCVTTDVGDARRIIADTGLVVSPNKPDELVSAWESMLIQSSEARQALGMKARQRIIERYALPVVNAQYESLYEALIDTPQEY